MADPLAAASLVMAVIAMLYGAWAADIDRSATLVLRTLRADRLRLDRPVIHRALMTKALPLWVGASAAVVIFAMRAAKIIGSIWTHPADAGFDDVGAAFVVTELAIVLLAFALGAQLLALLQKLAECSKPDA
jgi:hypothetical protein